MTPNEPKHADAEAASEWREVPELEPYYAGTFSTFGGGNVDWWLDYIRSELGRAHDFYQSQVANQHPAPPADHTECDRFIEMAVERAEKAEAEVERLREYKKLFNHALSCVDRVFQRGGQIERPILPDFARLGECKFEAVVRLAESYKRLTARAESAEAERDQLRKYDAQLAECCKVLERWPLASGCNGHLSVAGHLANILAEAERVKVLERAAVKVIGDGQCPESIYSGDWDELCAALAAKGGAEDGK